MSDQAGPTMQIGASSFGDTPQNPDGTHRPTSEAIRNLFEAIVHADAVGLDYYAVGEHHTTMMPASSPSSIINAAAGATKRIVLSSGVAVISTDDPVRVFQQFATADAVSGGGRIEIIAGRGSSVESFPLFGYDLRDYDQLYEEKLDLLLTINRGSPVRWAGTTRSAIRGLEVLPRPVHGSLPIWVGTGGSAPSSVRAGRLGLPISYGILGGEPHRFAPLVELYRRTAAKAGHSGDRIDVSVGTLGLIAPTKQEALERFYPGWRYLNIEMGKQRGWPAPDDRAFIAQAHAPGAYYVGDPDDVAERIAHLHGYLGHSRHFLQMDFGGLPQEHLLESITLLATEVKPRVERLLSKALVG